MAEQSKLKQLFDERERTNNEVTRQIFNQIEHVTSAVESYLKLSDNVQDGTFTWEDVAYSSEAHQDEGGLVILVGSVYYGGEPINFIRIAIPFDQAVESTTDDIVQFLENNSLNNDQVDDDQLSVLDDEDRILEQQDGESLVEPSSDQEQASWGQSFDLDQLNEHQKEQLRLHSLAAESNNNSRTN